MTEYEPSKEALATIKAFERLESWLGVKPTEAQVGSAIPSNHPADDVWGKPLEISFGVPRKARDFDDLDEMFPGAAEEQARTQASERTPSQPRQRPQTRQEGI